MARTRAQSAAKMGRVRAPKYSSQPRGIQKPRRPQTARHQNRSRCTRNKSSCRQYLETDSDCVADRLIDTLEKEPQSTSQYPLAQQRQDTPADSQDDELSNPIEYWAREGKWPRHYFEPKMEHLIARKKLTLSLSRKRSSSGTSVTPSDQRPREEKSAPYIDPRYVTLLEANGSFLDESDLGVADESKRKYLSLLSTEQTIPSDTLFRDDLFKETFRSVQKRNEARIIRDITPLIVPSAEILRIRGANHLKILIESLNEGWNNSVPLTGTRPQPDYSLGFKREAFSDSQLAKLSPYIGNYIGGDKSYFMATYSMYFPFLTCEVKCGAAGLDIADRQNAHSMTLAVRAVAELFRGVKREDEVNRQILGFSISHDHMSARIYGHYAVIQDKDMKFYCHPILNFSFTISDGKERWTAYRFIQNIYDVWMPEHFARICSAIDEIPSDQDLDDPSLPSTGL